MYKNFASFSLKLFKSFSSQKYNQDTIFALASGLHTAISIIRVSGSEANKVLQLVKQRNAKKIIQSPRLMQFTKIWNNKKQIIDQGMIVYFPKEQSYNNEDIFQLHVHGSKAVVDAVFSQLVRLNMRMAQRGQITKRAVINGKMSLNQAQAINDLINSENQFTRQISINNLLGKNINYIHNLKQQLVKCLAKSQAYIDFNEDQSDVKQTLFDDTKIQVKQKIVPRIQSLLRNYKNLKIVKDGLNTIIVGRPNVGKSTLINSLANKKISIVNSKPGTTRDIIQTSIQLEGFRLNLIDTAGLRSTDCQIQNEGVKMAIQKMLDSHIKILVIDPTQEQLTYNKQLKKTIIQLVSTDNYIKEIFCDRQTVVVLNKMDLLDLHLIESEIKIVLKVIPSEQAIHGNRQIIQKKPNIFISASKQMQIDSLFNILARKLNNDFGHFLNPNQIFFTRQRYFSHLKICLQKLQLYLKEQQIDFACQYLRESIKQLQQIFGRVDSEDVLDVLFKDFCIGK